MAKTAEMDTLSDGELQVTRDDSRLLVVACGVASQLENLGSKVLEDRSKVDRGTGTNTLGVVLHKHTRHNEHVGRNANRGSKETDAFAQETVDTANGELKTGLGRAVYSRHVKS